MELAASKNGAVFGAAVAFAETLVGPVSDLFDHDEVGGVVEFGDDVELGFLNFSRSVVVGCPAVVLLETVPSDLGEVGLGRVAVGDVDAGQDPLPELELDDAPVGDAGRVGDGLGVTGEKTGHLFGGFEERVARRRFVRFETREGGCVADGR